MSTIKTKQTTESVHDFILNFADTAKKQEDSFKIIEIMESFTGCPPKMWGPSIIGFGCYHYKSKKSRQEGDWPLLGFSPRKSAISLYVYSGLEKHKHLLEDLGKFKMGKSCIYVKKLEDINLKALEKIMQASVDNLREHYEIKEG